MYILLYYNYIIRMAGLKEMTAGIRFGDLFIDWPKAVIKIYSFNLEVKILRM